MHAELIAWSLSSRDIRLREAGARAADLLRSTSVRSILARHNEPVKWLAAFLEKVAASATQ
jgi:hypothetical protein